MFSLRLGDLGLYARPALLRVRYRAVGHVAMDDGALALWAVLRIAIKVKIFLLDVQAPKGGHAPLWSADFSPVETDDMRDRGLVH